MGEDIVSFTVEFPSRFQNFAESAFLRLQVRYSQHTFRLGDGCLEVVSAAGVPSEGLRRDILHAIYAEKVFAETLPMRQALMAAVMAR